MKDHDSDGQIDLQISEVISRWLQQPPETRQSPDQLIAQHPELHPGLGETLWGLEFVERGVSGIVSETQPLNLATEASEHSPDIPGFEILSELGRGGMGIVYEAQQPDLDRVVALKVLPLGNVDPRAVQRFRREAETIAALDHPGIVPIFAVGVDHGMHWYAMRRIDGEPLDRWLARQTFDSPAERMATIVRLGIEAADALEHAHRNGVIHRDVKPGNLLIDSSGKAWLTDFGLARREVDVTATATGTMLGTPRYMSSEQISQSDDRIDARTDVYSLGATLYEMATRTPVFDSQSPLELLTQIQRDDPVPPRKLCADIPRPLELVILKCLDKDPRHRYGSAAALADDLRAVKDARPIAAKGLPPWVTAMRYWRRNESSLRITGTAVFSTILAVAAMTMIWLQHRRSKSGDVQLDTPGGLYIANIQPKPPFQNTDEPSSSTLVTTPMQQSIELPAASYQVRFEGKGRLSETADLDVIAGEEIDLRYVDRREAPTSIDIHQKLARSTADGSLVTLDLDSLSCFEPDGSQRYSIDLETLAGSLPSRSERFDDTIYKQFKDSDTTLPLFAFDPTTRFQGDSQVDDSPFAQVKRLEPLSVDLNRDGSDDLLVTADGFASLVAVTHDGDILWRKDLPMVFEKHINLAFFPQRDMPREAIVGIQAVPDTDQDGVSDLIINAALLHPTGSCRPAIFVLSGASGDVLRHMPLATFDMSKVVHWPWAGLLKFRRSFNSDDRSTRMMHHAFYGSRVRSQTVTMDNRSWSHAGAGSAIYVLPELIQIPKSERPDSHLCVATCIDQSVRFFDLTDSTEIGNGIDLKQPICSGPVRIQLENGSWGVLVLTGLAGTAFTQCKLHLCVAGETKPRWTVNQQVSAYDLAVSAQQATLPMAVDLNGDGIDEVLSTTIDDAHFSWPRIHCYTSQGAESWASDLIVGISRAVEHCLVMRDLDDDGVRDLVAVSLATYPGTQTAPSETGLRVVADFISGATGKRIGFRQERLTSGNADIPIAEIDFARIDQEHLYCSVVYGDSAELGLSSASIIMDLADPDATSVGRGLTRLPGIPDLQTRGQWYRQRSGPFLPAADHAVWNRAVKTEKRFGKQTLLLSWQGPDGAPRILMSGKDGIRCIDPIDDSELWQHPIEVDPNISHLIHRDSGHVDILLQQNSFAEAKPTLYDGETGRLRFAIDPFPMGEIRAIRSAPNDSPETLYAVAEAEHQFSGVRAKATQPGFWLLKLNPKQKSVVWSRLLYDDCSDLHSHHEVAKMILFDVNGDGTDDVITGDSHRNQLTVSAFDGRDGNALWNHQTKLTAQESDWPWKTPWPMIEPVPCVDGMVLATLDRGLTPSHARLITIHPRTGEEIDSLAVPIQNNLRSEVMHWGTGLHPLSPSKPTGLLGMRFRSVPGFDPQWSVIQTGTGKETLQTVKTFETKQRMLFVTDPNDESSLQRIEFDINEISVFPADQTKPVSQFSLPNGSLPLRVEPFGTRQYLVCRDSRENYGWHRLPGGELDYRCGNGFRSTTVSGIDYPRLLESPSGPLAIGTTPEYVLLSQVDQLRGPAPTAHPTDVFMNPPQVDPRYRRMVSALGVFETYSLNQIVTLALKMLFAIVFPLLYVMRLVFSRRWTLRYLLLAPAITMIALVFWSAAPSSTLAINGNDVAPGLLALAGIASLVYCIVKQQWKLFLISCLLGAVMAMMFLFGSASALVSRSPEVIPAWGIAEWIVSTAAITAQATLPMTVAAQRLLILRQRRWAPEGTIPSNSVAMAR